MSAGDYLLDCIRSLGDAISRFLVIGGSDPDDSTAYPFNSISLGGYRGLAVLSVDDTGNPITGTITGRKTYMASGTFTPAATPTDLVIIEGSATKTIRVLGMIITTTNTAAGSQQFLLVKRSAADTTGTFVAATQVPLDSANAAGSVNRVGHFTANPGALGTAVGTIVTKRVASPAAVPASFAGVVTDAGVNLLEDLNRASTFTNQPQGVVLHGVAETLAINFAGAALVSGQTHAYMVIWTEE